jgi:phosphohistidine phosphatase
MAMAVFLSQHGKSASKDIDPNRGLTEEGAAEVKHVASMLQQGRIHVASIQHSGKDRARQTAELFAMAVNPEEGVLVCKGLDPLDDVTVFAKQLDASADQMYVGHQPFMQRLVSYLVADEQARPVVAFQNGGVVCMDFDSDNECWIIKWILVSDLS